MKRLPLTLAALACAATLVAGCGTGAVPTAAPTGGAPMPTVTAPADFNDTDVMFLQMMLALHGPADQMLRIARERAKRDEVRTLAAAIEVTQADETAQMTIWLETWKQPLQADPADDAHAAHGGMPPNGDKEIEILRTIAADEFDVTFLNMLIGQQHRAVELARMELAGGSDRETKALADRVVKSRQAQIKLMLGYVAA